MMPAASLPAICQSSLLQVMRPELFKALSDPTRIAIIATLATEREPASVTDIAENCGIDFSGVSRHLKLLKEAGLLSSEKTGRVVRYHLKSDELVATLQGFADAIKLCQNQASD